MKRTTASLTGMIAVAALLSCASPNEPVPSDGRVVLRIEPARAPAATSSDAPASIRAAVTFDSVMVRVFRGGTGIVLETSKGAPLTGDPVEVTVGCVAENHKRVSVELFNAGVMTYHGANTDVNVQVNKRTDVAVDAYEFMVDTLQVSPTVVPDGSTFSLRWNAAAAAAWYQVQSSSSPDFASIEWEQSVTDTVVDHQSGAGSHYFRVIPRTPFARGHAEGPQFGYVSSASAKVLISGFRPAAVIPGERFVILGENLDFPGTQAWIGPDELTVESASWDSLVVTLPLVAKTNTVTVVSGFPALGSDTSAKTLVVLRVAYVSINGTYAAEYVTALEKHSDDFGSSGVAIIPIEDLDTRNMNVFDIVVVGHDTGTLPVNWGNGQPGRASAIALSRANVLAIGKGGAVFLALVASAASAPQATGIDDGTYYVNDASAPIFKTPHSVGGARPIFSAAATTVTFQIGTAPAGVSLYASTDDNGCPLLICSPNDKWVLADFRFQNAGGADVVYFFWGNAGDPTNLTTAGSDCLGNVMNLLYTN